MRSLEYFSDIYSFCWILFMVPFFLVYLIFFLKTVCFLEFVCLCEVPELMKNTYRFKKSSLLLSPLPPWQRKIPKKTNFKLYTYSRDTNCCSQYEKQYEGSLKNYRVTTVQQSVLGIYPEKTLIRKDTCILAIIAALLTIAKNRRNLSIHQHMSDCAGSLLLHMGFL